MCDIDLTFVDQTVSRIGSERDKVLDILQSLQAHYGYLPQPALLRVCEVSAITPSDIQAVATFYSQFRHKPAGRHHIQVCVGTACHVKGADKVYEAFRKQLDLAEDSDTDSDMLFTVSRVSCLGCCTLAPAVKIDQATYGHVTPDSVGRVIDDFLSRSDQAAGPALPDENPENELIGQVNIGLGSCCVSQGSGTILDSVKEFIAASGSRIALKRVGCVGMCHQTPMMELVNAEGKRQLFTKVLPSQVESILLGFFRPQTLAQRVRFNTTRLLDSVIDRGASEPLSRHETAVREKMVNQFLSHQVRVATEGISQCDPLDIEEYIAAGGFEAFRACLEKTGGAIIDIITKSGLRGRGGAGYPTGLKWQAVADSPESIRYVICNGDEGDPGAFMDRMLLESCPFRVIEGMLIAAYSVKSAEGIFYIRSEYPLALERVAMAIETCRRKGLLGENILDSGFSFDIQIKQGAGAFVCGEETALIKAVEGKRGMPVFRPPYPAQRGLHDKPTLINNVETFATISWIAGHGYEAYHTTGTEQSKGTKVFALAGKVARGGLIEVPMGITIRQIVDEIGGGVLPGRTFKAVQVGGPSGGCVPAEFADTPIDYQALAGVGAIMGSGGLVVLDNTDCMVDIARYFLEFTQDQSCGKCTFCRIGTRRMLEILEKICAGQAKLEDIDTLESLAHTVRKSSLCGLGKTAPNPVLSTLKFFRDEYVAHINGSCPAGKCTALISYSITDDCIGCGLCASHCPVDAIEFNPYEKHVIDHDKCVKCDTCRKICPVNAVVVE